MDFLYIIYMILMFVFIAGIPTVFFLDFDKLLGSSKREAKLLRKKSAFDQLEESIQNKEFNGAHRDIIIKIVENNVNRCWKVSKIKALQSAWNPSATPLPDREQIDDARVFDYLQEITEARDNLEILSRYGCSQTIDFNDFSASDQQELEEIYWNQVYRSLVKTIDSYYASIEARKSSSRSAREITKARRELMTDPYARDFKQLRS